MLLALLIVLHLLSAVIWIGGMFFAYLALRPAAASVLEPPLRLELWAKVFARFFPWVWMAIVLLPVSGYWLAILRYGSLGNLPLYINIMQGLGWLMILIFLHLNFAPYRRFRQAVSGRDFPEAGKRLNQIRIMIGSNLLLGLLMVCIAAGGRYLG